MKTNKSGFKQVFVIEMAILAILLSFVAVKANAGEVKVVDRQGGNQTLEYIASPGEENDVEIKPGVGGFIIDEASIPISSISAPTCTSIDITTVACPEGTIDSFSARLGDGTNRFKMKAELPAYVSATEATRNVFVGGPANDHLSGSAGADVLYGADGPDDLNGGNGDDFLSSGDGDDTVHGGPDDDFIPADNGADNLVGDAGFDTVDYSSRTKPVGISFDGEMNDGTISGPFQFAENDRVQLIESALGGSGNDVISGSDESEHLVGNGGDDRITGNSGFDVIEGNAGEDGIDGGELGDEIDGGPQADVIDGLGSSDQVTGGAGDDLIESRDGVIDSVNCGEGIDTANSDEADSKTDCELPEPIVVIPDPEGPKVKIGPMRTRVGALGKARLKVTCPATAATACSGTLALTRKDGKKIRKVGSYAFTATAGKSKFVTVKFKTGIRSILRKKNVRLKATATVVDAGSAPAVTSTQVTLLKKK